MNNSKLKPLSANHNSNEFTICGTVAEFLLFSFFLLSFRFQLVFLVLFSVFVWPSACHCNILANLAGNRFNLRTKCLTDVLNTHFRIFIGYSMLIHHRNSVFYFVFVMQCNVLVLVSVDWCAYNTSEWYMPNETRIKDN